MKTRAIISILTIFILNSCSQKSKNRLEQSDKQNINDTISQIQIVTFKYSKAVIFPASYMTGTIKPSPYSREQSFFTPNEETIKYIEKRLPETSDIINHFWGDSDEWQKSLKITAKFSHLYDKQYYGYINSKKDSVIVITLYNFETDPYKIQNKFNKVLIGGADGWFNTNSCYFEYYLQTKSFKSVY